MNIPQKWCHSERVFPRCAWATAGRRLQRVLSSSSCRFVSFLGALERESEMKGRKTSLFIFSFFPLFFSCCLWTCRLFYIQYLSSNVSVHMLLYVIFTLLHQYRALFLDSEEDANIWVYGWEDRQSETLLHCSNENCLQSEHLDHAPWGLCVFFKIFKKID